MPFPDGYPAATEAEIPTGLLPIVVDVGGTPTTRYVPASALGAATPAPVTFTLAFSATAGPVAPGDPVTLTATVSRAAVVRFYDGDPDGVDAGERIGPGVAADAGSPAELTFSAQAGATYALYARATADADGAVLTEGPLDRTVA